MSPVGGAPPISELYPVTSRSNTIVCVWHHHIFQKHTVWIRRLQVMENSPFHLMFLSLII